MASRRQTSRGNGSPGTRHRSGASVFAALLGVVVILTFALGQTVTSAPPTSSPSIAVASDPSDVFSQLMLSHDVAFVPLTAAQKAALGALPALAIVKAKAQADLTMGTSVEEPVYLGLAASATTPTIPPLPLPSIPGLQLPSIGIPLPSIGLPGAFPSVPGLPVPSLTPAPSASDALLTPTAAYALVLRVNPSGPPADINGKQFTRVCLFLDAKSAALLVAVGLD